MRKKTALISGFTRGIGASLTEELLASDYKVIGLSKSRSNIKNFKNKHFRYKDNLCCFEVDVRNFNSLKKIANEIGELDLLILNAGIYMPMDAAKPDIKSFKVHNDINYMGVINCYCAFLRQMSKTQSF